MLRVVEGGLALAAPPLAAGPEWEAGLAQLLGWLGIARDPAPAPAALRFAPWLCHSPVALQGAPDGALPPADWLASYLFDPVPGPGPCRDPLDLVLMSPHPAATLPRPQVLAAMLAAARAEGRSRLAIIVGAAARPAMAAHLQAEAEMLAGEGGMLEVLSVEQALPGLMAARARWQAVLVEPELRSIVFALLAETHRTTAPWPLLWQRGAALAMVGAESLAPAEGPLPLDAVLLVQALALALRRSGLVPAALRLCEGWAHQAGSGVVTATRGSPAPYATTLADAEWLRLLCTPPAASARPVPRWGALAAPRLAGTDRLPVRLSVVASSVASRCPFPAS